MWEKAQYGEMGSSAGFKERLTDWVQVCWGEGFGREGSPDEGDGPGWRKGAKGRKEAQFQGWGWVAGVVKGPEGADGGPWGPGTSSWKREEASGAAEGGGGEPAPGRYLSWVFIILGGSAQGGRRRRGEWVGGRMSGCGVARAGRSLRAKSLSGRGPRALLLPQRAPASN